MNKKFFINSIILSIIIFGGVFLFCQSAQAGVVQFGDKNIFVNFDELPFDLSNWAPGMSEQKSIIIENNENFDINIYFGAKKTSGDDVLADILTLNVGNQSKHISELFNENIELPSVNSGESQNYDITISFDQEAGNEYQGKIISFDFVIIAEQIEVIIPGGGGSGYLPPGLTIKDESVEITELTGNSVVITWDTSYSSTSQVIYAAEGENYSFDLTKPNYGYPHAFPDPEDPTKVTFHSVTISGLAPGTTYYYRCVSHASLAISQEYSFTTLSGEEEVVGEEEEEEEEEGEEEEEEEKPGPIVGEEEEEEEKPGPIVGEEEEEEEEEEEKAKTGLSWLLAAVGVTPFNLKVILIIVGIIILGLIILWLIRRRKNLKQP